MSDCFNHSLDAFDSYEASEQGYGYSYGKSKEKRKTFEVIQVVLETEKAFLLRFSKEELPKTLLDYGILRKAKTIDLWFPKSAIIDSPEISKGSTDFEIFVNSDFLRACLENAINYYNESS